MFHLVSGRLGKYPRRCVIARNSIMKKDEDEYVHFAVIRKYS